MKSSYNEGFRIKLNNPRWIFISEIIKLARWQLPGPGSCRQLSEFRLGLRQIYESSPSKRLVSFSLRYRPLVGVVNVRWLMGQAVMCGGYGAISKFMLVFDRPFIIDNVGTQLRSTPDHRVTQCSLPISRQGLHSRPHHWLHKRLLRWAETKIHQENQTRRWELQHNPLQSSPEVPLPDRVLLLQQNWRSP